MQNDRDEDKDVTRIQTPDAKAPKPAEDTDAALTRVMPRNPPADSPAQTASTEPPVTVVSGLEKTEVLGREQKRDLGLERTEARADLLAADLQRSAAVYPDSTEVMPGEEKADPGFERTEIMDDAVPGAPQGAAVSALDKTELMGGDGTEVSGVERTEVMTDAHAEVVPGERTEITGSLNTEMPAAPLSSGATNLAVGDIIDKRFVLAQELGRGGMSRVYRAKDLIKERAGDANPYVALKILSGDFSLHPDAWIALQQEISKTQSLAHPRIVTVHDFKIDSDLGLPFAQMEEMRGESLEEVINRHPEGLEDSKRVQEIIMALAEGLGYAHSRGIVHADLKPSNVFVTEEGDIKLLDFGIARFIPGKQNKGGRGEVFGEGGLSALTPTYASPEMFAGEAPLPADDLYALGVIAVELGSGKHPFDSVLGSPQPAVAAADAGLVPQRFPGLTAAQWRAVSGCLKADRTLRPEDGDQFLTMFRPKSAWLRALTVLSVVLAITVVVVWVRAQQKRPDTPFEELPVDLQVRIEQFLDLGNEALSYRDVNGALEHFADAYRLHPKNARAIDGHEEVVELIADSPLPETAGQLRRRQQQAEAMLAYPALEDSGELKSYIQTLSDLEVD